jgi:hypothetical protein
MAGGRREILGLPTMALQRDRQGRDFSNLLPALAVLKGAAGEAVEIIPAFKGYF